MFLLFFFFFFNDTATTEIYTLSLHDALPIFFAEDLLDHFLDRRHAGLTADQHDFVDVAGSEASVLRSEEHTSELQSQSNLVCRLLLEKKKKYYYSIYYVQRYKC